MNTENQQVEVRTPSLITALLGGFDSTANHLSVIMFPIALDLILWLGPRLRIKQLINDMLEQLTSLPGVNTPETKDMMALSREVWKVIAEHANVMSALRSYPVGVTSLMNQRLPVASPLGTPGGWEVTLVQLLGLWIGLTVIGLMVGNLYFGLTAQVALSNKVDWQQVLHDWPRTFLQVIWLAVFLSILLLLISIPIGLLFSLIALTGSLISQLILFVLSGILLWLFLPVLFSPHGIFVKRMKMFASFIQGIRLTQFTLSKTGLFFLTIFIISQGLDVLWRIPPETSWLSLIGIAGHAFVTTSLLAASFIYYQAADQWLLSLARKARLAEPTQDS
jgi:hypothetical protein